MNVRLLVSVGRRPRVKTDMTKAVHYHPVHQVNSLSGTCQVHLGPVVLTGGAMGVSWGRGWGDSSIPAQFRG